MKSEDIKNGKNWIKNYFSGAIAGIFLGFGIGYVISHYLNKIQEAYLKRLDDTEVLVIEKNAGTETLFSVDSNKFLPINSKHLRKLEETLYEK